ncbi:hypothetical protein Vi05172_g381 [Venturia inaequalis]|nr:hypothetical protein Vi05172_g381 [Venturia inaequalis]
MYRMSWAMYDAQQCVFGIPPQDPVFERIRWQRRRVFTTLLNLPSRTGIMRDAKSRGRCTFGRPVATFFFQYRVPLALVMIVVCRCIWDMRKRLSAGILVDSWRLFLAAWRD